MIRVLSRVKSSNAMKIVTFLPANVTVELSRQIDGAKGNSYALTKVPDSIRITG